MRTIKASEVRKGMRVEYTRTSPDGVEVTVRGPVTAAPLTDFPMKQTRLALGDCGEFFHGFTIAPDHPVTVLAEPEPEWVEGAWYRIGGTVCIRKGRGFYTDAEDDDPRPDVEDVSGLVLGRVLIVDWPGDDVARELETNGGHHNGIGLGPIKKVCRAVAYAIRTQGGAR